MEDRFRQTIASLDEFEPGGIGEEVAATLVAAAIAIARAVESIQSNPAGTSVSSIQELDQKIGLLNEKLDHFVKVLSSLPGAEE